MPQSITTITTAQVLFQHELFAFSSRTVSDLFTLDKVQTARLLQRMETEGLIACVERGKYVLLGLTPERVFSNPLFVGSHLVSPSYVSFWSALHFHGFTEQAPLTVFVAISRQKKELHFRGMTFRFVTLKAAAFFGYRRERLADLPVVVADESKAILDSLSLPEYAGGVAEVAKALRISLTEGRVNVSELIEYTGRLHNRSLSSRLGYLLESLGQATEGLEPSRGPVRLDPQKPLQGKYHPHWKVYVNLPHDDLFPEGVA